MEYLEAHVEHLLGRHVVDVDGKSVGRVEELRAEIVDGETVVTELHVGTVAFFERIAAFVTQLPFFEYIPFARSGYKVPWQQFDLSNPRALRVKVRRDELRQIDLADTAGKR